MAQPFGGVCGKVVDVIETTLCEEEVYESRIGDAAANERRRRRDVVEKPTGQVIEHAHIVPTTNQSVSDMGSDEPGATGDEHAAHES